MVVLNVLKKSAKATNKRNKFLLFEVGYEHSHHVVADYVSFATTFLLKSHRLTHAVAPPFRKKSRSAHLLGCKRPRDGSLSLPTFCGFKSVMNIRTKAFKPEPTTYR